MTDAARYKQLAELLIDLFQIEELQRFFDQLHPKLSAELATGLSLREYATSLVDLLRRHGELDDDFFAALDKERPRRITEIDELAAHFPLCRPGRAAGSTPLDVEIAEIEARIATLDQDGLDSQRERAELLNLRRARRAFPTPRRGACLAGRFTLDSEIGEGGFASVWRAFDRRERRQVALKILHSHHAADTIRRQRFARGMRTMGSIDHANILQVYEPEVMSDGFVFAVLELISGGDLQQAYLNGQVRPDDVWGILLAICEALAPVHDRGLVHRDIKPSNILLTDSRAPRLTDFDLVLDHDTTGGTRTGALGSVLFSAPELWMDARAATAADDVYSLAMTAVFAHLGAPLSLRIIRDTNGVLDDLALPPALRDVLRRALAWEREERYRDARELGDALQAAVKRPRPTAESTGPFMDHDILYWVADGRGRAETIWLTEEQGRARVVSRTPGLVLAGGDRIWVLQGEIRQIEAGETLHGDRDAYRVIAIEVDAADLVEVGINHRIPVGIFKSPSTPDIPVGVVREGADDGYIAEYEHSVSAVFSAGPYVFVRSFRHVYCYGAAHGSDDVDFEVLDLRSGETADVLSSEELASVLHELEAATQKQFMREHEGMEEFDEPSLTMCYASYDLQGELQLSYQLTRDTFYYASDKEWSDYTCSIRLPAPRLPSALAPYGTAPRLLQSYWHSAPHYAGSHGWTAAPRTADVRQRLRRCFEELRKVSSHSVS